MQFATWFSISRNCVLHYKLNCGRSIKYRLSSISSELIMIVNVFDYFLAFWVRLLMIFQFFLHRCWSSPLIFQLFSLIESKLLLWLVLYLHFRLWLAPPDTSTNNPPLCFCFLRCVWFHSQILKRSVISFDDKSSSLEGISSRLCSILEKHMLLDCVSFW